MIKNIYGPTWNCRNNYFSKTSFKKPQTLKTHFSQNLFTRLLRERNNKSTFITGVKTAIMLNITHTTSGVST